MLKRVRHELAAYKEITLAEDTTVAPQLDTANVVCRILDAHKDLFQKEELKDFEDIIGLDEEFDILGDVLVGTKGIAFKEVGRLEKSIKLADLLISKLEKELATIQNKVSKQRGFLFFLPRLDSKLGLTLLEKDRAAIKAIRPELEKSHAFMLSFFPKERNCTFEELDQHIYHLQRELTNTLSSIELLASSKIMPLPAEGLGLLATDVLVEKFFHKAPTFVYAILRNHSISNELVTLTCFAQDRMPEFRHVLESWTKQRLRTELLWRKSDLERMPSSQPQYFVNSPNYYRHGQKIILPNPYPEIRRYCEHIAFEIEALTETGLATGSTDSLNRMRVPGDHALKITESDVKRFFDVLEAGDMAARRQAAKELGGIGSSRIDEGQRPEDFAWPEAVQALSNALLHRDSLYVRRHSAWALGQIHDERAVPALVEAARDQDIYLRHIVVDALGEIKCVGAIAALGEILMKDVDKNIRRRAADKLGRTGSPAGIQLLAVGLKDRDAGVREYAARALGKIDHPGIVSVLKSALRDEDDGVRRAVQDSLGKARNNNADLSKSTGA
jgi:hypothetical protein